MGCGSSKVKKQPAANGQTAKPAETAVATDSPAALRMKRLKEQLDRMGDTYRHNKCGATGEVSPLFPPKGLCYHIVQNDRWLFYNDTMNYAMHLNYEFPPDSDVTPGERSQVQTAEDGWKVVSAVVNPLETIEFARGEMKLHRSRISAQPITDDFFENIEELTEGAKEEVQRAMDFADGSLDEEVVLQRCVEADAPFVDPNFMPSRAMLSRHRVDGRTIAPKELRRPKELPGVNVGNIDAVRGDVFPQFIDGGMLCDTWFMSAVSILGMDEERVRNVFSLSKPEEKRLGAYRVVLNKDGWWKTVLIDDFLPTLNGTPCFARIKNDPCELWVSLLQKAYAKVHGSYACITGGDTLHALRDFSGAPTYRLDDKWATAVRDPYAANKLLEEIARYVEAGNVLLLSTPVKPESEEDAPTGLRAGHTYCVEALRRFPSAGLTLLKIHNPWEPKCPWKGAWSANCENWERHPAVKAACNPDFTAVDGSFWMEWADVAKHFDGCGLLYATQAPVYDYRVRGCFDHINPNVVLKIHVNEPVEVMLTLTQRDKRGLALDDPDAKLSPLMLSVSHDDGNKQRVEMNSSMIPDMPKDEYTFVVAREVAMTYKFEPSDEPYFVIPRVHRKGISEEQQKTFVLGMLSLTPLDNKLDVQFTQLDAASPVFKNRALFVVEETPEVFREFQKRSPEGVVTTDVGYRLSRAALPKHPDRAMDGERELPNGLAGDVGVQQEVQ